MTGEYESISKFDRIRGGLEGVALFTKASTIQHVQQLTGKAETFVVRTARCEDMGGDFILIECIDDGGVTRIALPPRVANAVASQRDALTARRRSAAAKRVAADRKARGEVPGFMRKRAAK
jgi:hypothetical protein